MPEAVRAIPPVLILQAEHFVDKLKGIRTVVGASVSNLFTAIRPGVDELGGVGIDGSHGLKISGGTRLSTRFSADLSHSSRSSISFRISAWHGRQA